MMKESHPYTKTYNIAIDLLKVMAMLLLWNRLRYSYNFLNNKLTHYYIWVIIMIVL